MLTIEAVANGYVVSSPRMDDCGPGAEKTVVEVEEDIQDENEAETKATQKLLYVIMEYFGLIGSKHDKTRVRVTIEKKDVDY